MNRGILAALLLASLSGCLGLGGGKVPPELLTLTTEQAAPVGHLASARQAEAVLVAEPETDRRLAAHRVAVQIDASRVAYLKDAVWVERPSRLFRSLLAEALRARGGRLVLEEDQAAGIAGMRLSGRLIDMGYDARAGAVVVRFDAVKTAGKGEVTMKRFESVVAGIAPKAETVGPALNQAANDVARQVAEWVQ